MKHQVIHEIPRPVPAQPIGLGMRIFKIFLVIIAIVLVVIATRHKILRISVDVFDVTSVDTKSQDDTELVRFEMKQRGPDLEWLGLDSDEMTFRRYNLSYMHGHRKKGDTLVYRKRKQHFFAKSRNFTFAIRYPRRLNKLGANITQIALYVIQTSRDGQAVIRKGGIGYRNVNIEVTSYNTTQCRYTVHIYGVNKHKEA